jgi:hypothetical protein
MSVRANLAIQVFQQGQLFPGRADVLLQIPFSQEL